MERKSWWLAEAMAAAVALGGFSAGCSNDDDDDDGGTSGSYAGTWTGNVAGRGLTMVLAQNGVALNGSYTLSDPEFTEPLVGSVSSQTPPATAVLTALDGRQFTITFSSYNAFSGTFYNRGNVLGANGTK